MVEGSKDFTVYYVDGEATVNFGNTATAVSGDNNEFETDLGAKTVKYFDASAIVATYTATNGGEASGTIDNSDLKITVTDAKTNKAATVADLKKPGTWNVNVSYVGKDEDGMWVAVQDTAKVTVSYKTLDEANIYASVNNKNVADKGTAEIQYTGEDLTDKISVVVKTANATLVEGTDYEVVIKKDGKEVSEVKGIGVYTVTVKSDAFTQTLTFDLTVTEKTITPVQQAGDREDTLLEAATYNTDNSVKTEAVYGATYFYTGNAISVPYKYNTSKTTVPNYVDLPEGSYTAEITSYTDKDGVKANKKSLPTEVKEVGTYEITIKDATDEDGYAVDTKVLHVVVSDQKVFIDVPSTAWYAQSVYEAATQGYVKGYNDGDVFGPNDNIKRQDVVVILARMAGVYGSSEDSSSSQTSYATTFEDVEENAYYAKAVAWAQKAGIVTGTSATTFEPGRDITREEFATMLSRYATLRDGSATGDTASLSKYADGTSVDTWAQNAVAWAVDNNIMGVNISVLNPVSTITRAEVAAMVIRYQPERDNLLI
jgi:hypothetical protein